MPDYLPTEVGRMAHWSSCWATEWLMQGYWLTDSRVLADWCRSISRLMPGSWPTDAGLLANGCGATAKLMLDYWPTDTRLLTDGCSLFNKLMIFFWLNGFFSPVAIQVKKMGCWKTVAIIVWKMNILKLHRSFVVDSFTCSGLRSFEKLYFIKQVKLVCNNLQFCFEISRSLKTNLK